MKDEAHSRRRAVAAGWVVSVAAAAVVGWWAADATLAPPDDPLPAPELVLFTVGEGRVGRGLSFSAVAEWQLNPLAPNAAAGVVTSVVHDDAQEAAPGDVLYTVDLRPVVVGEGAVPAFRDLARGSRGPDVAQLQTLLADLGYLDGEPDGNFGAGTRRAVRDWQDDLGVDDDGVVRRGDVVWVPELPVRVAFADAVRVGARLADGQETVLAVPEAPDVWIPLTVDQRDLVPLSADVVVRHPDGEWAGRIGTVEEVPESGQLLLRLEGHDGGAVCGTDCAQRIAVDARGNFVADIVVVPATRGPVVPVAALSTGPDGDVAVVRPDGTRLAVTIVASSDGLAVVEGVEPGTQILLHAGESQQPPAEAGDGT